MKMRKSLALILILAMLLALAGCSTGTPAPTASSAATVALTASAVETATTATATATTAAPTAPEANSLRKFDPPVTITVAAALRGTPTWREGDSLEDNPITRWMRDKLGIIEQYKWVVTDVDNAYNTRIQLALSSGEELPDVLKLGHDELLSNLIEADRIQPVDDSFEKYATDRIKLAYEKNPSVWNYVKKDGKRWAMPEIADGYVGDTILWIRQDWLDKLGLKAPATLDDVQKVLDAFTNNDPDGNGAKDTYGLAIGGNSGSSTPLGDWMGDVQFLFGQKQPYLWLKGSDSKLSYGSLNPVVKQGLGVLQDWYKKGYISPDFVTQDAVKSAGEFTGGKAGMYFAPGWCGGWPIGDAVTAAKAEGKVLDAKPYPLPSGLNGDVGRAGSPISYFNWVFRKGFDHMDAIFQIWDIVYGTNIYDESSPFAIGWAEGYDYVMKDGKPVWSDIPGGAIDLWTSWPVNSGNTPPNVIPGDNIYQRVAKGEMDSIYEQKLKAKNGELTIFGFATVFQQMDKDVPHYFVGLPTKTMVSSMAGLQKLEEETQLKIIVGEKPLEYYDEFVQQWLSGGGTQITAEVNQWFEQVNK